MFDADASRGASTFVQLVRDGAQRAPDKQICHFLVDVDAGTASSLTYGQLDTRARAVARLRTKARRRSSRCETATVPTTCAPSRSMLGAQASPLMQSRS